MRMSKLLMLPVFVISLLVVAAPAKADTCFQLDPFIDVIQVSAQVSASGMMNLWGKWVACGFYSSPVVGSAFKVGLLIPEPGFYRMGLHATADPGACASSQPAIDVALNATFRDGTGVWQGQCGDFSVSGTLRRVSCPAPCVNAPYGTPALQ